MNMKTPKKSPGERNFCHKLSFHISNGLGNSFYRLGYLIASNPWKTIAASWLLVACCSVGLLAFHNEKNPLKLWIPQDSKFIRDTHWLMKKFEEVHRTQNVLVTAPDVLEPHVLQKIAQISKGIEEFQVKLPNGTFIGWNDVCFQIPNIAEIVSQRRKRQADDDDDFNFDEFNDIFLNKPVRPFNPSVDLDPGIYCSIIEKLPIGCLQQNILELWKFDDVRIGNLTKDDILHAVNTVKISPASGHDTDFVHFLGGIKRNSSGYIVAAEAVLSSWMVYVNFSDVNHDKIGNSAGTEDWASEEALIWENEYLKTMHELHKNVSDNETKIFYTAGRSYGDISSATMFQDMDKLFIGSLLMFIYLEVVLSKFSWIELRIIFGSLGLLSVGMAFISSIGICSIMGVSYGPVHTSLPFLLMGLGVDDIFVIMACWRQVEAMNTGCTIPERMGLMLKRAGASITITSFTDIVAFLIGASTILPSLESFCIFAAVGVFLTYLFAITFVVAVFTLDERRIKAKRNSCIPCIVHEKSKADLWCARDITRRSLKSIYSRVILTKPGKIIVLLTVVCYTGFSLDGLLKLQQKFDPTWFIPDHTYLHKYLEKQNVYYPDLGFKASVFMGELNYTVELQKIFFILNQIENRSDLVHDITAWPKPFHSFVQTYYNKDIFQETLSDYEWRLYLSKFLFSHSGGKYQANFKFEKKLKCGEPASNVTVSSIDFRYKRFDERNDYVPAMHAIEDIVDNAHMSSGDGYSTVWGRIYGNWITDEVIDTEVLRNIALALICVMACTSVLIVNLQTCFYIFICVLLTLINVCGFMQRWGLTIDLVSCIGLQLAVGLCVDYSAHIGHTFLTISEGTKSERALETISHIGAAVFYGGGSTLLAIAMLANSEAYTFSAFFKIFMLVIIFGQYHGLVFLPVVLSLIGPDPYVSSTKDEVEISSRKSLEEDGTEMISFIKPREDKIENDVNEKLNPNN